MQLEGKVALVTGGARGLGRSIALAYAREGADVAVTSRTASEAQEVAGEISGLGRKGLALIAELTDMQATQRAVQEAIHGLGKVDILVNNAGGYRMFTHDLVHQVSVLQLTVEEWHLVIEANLTTAFNSSKAVLPHMVERRSGVIIYMTSYDVARRGRAGEAAYSASKAAVERLAECLAEEHSEDGIAVNVLDPGWNVTRANDDYDAEVHKRMRLPDDVGPSAVFLALQTPETMTGEVLQAPEFDREHGIHVPSAYERLDV